MHDTTVSQLRGLVQVNIDSCRLLDRAASAIAAAPIANVFRQIAADRRLYLDELRRLVPSKDAAPSGTLRGTIHRWWVAVRAKLNGGDEHVVLVEAERGEDVIKATYEDAMDAIADPAIYELLRGHYIEVKHSHDVIRGLRDVSVTLHRSGRGLQERGA